MSSSCRSLEVEGGVRLKGMVHLDPGPKPSHKLERANSCLQQGREADHLEHRLMHHGGVGRKGEGEHPLAPGPVLYIDTAVDRGR